MIGLGAEEPRVAHALDVIDLFAQFQRIEIAGQQAVAVEIKLPAFLGQEEAEVIGRNCQLTPPDPV